jgi:hypothetical protein
MKKLREEAFHSALSNLDNKLHHTHAVNDAITQLEKIDQLPFADGEERARLMTVLQRCKETVERDMAALSDEADLQALEDRILPVTQELSEYERGLLAIQDNIFTHLGMVMRIVVARKKEEESMTNDFICSNESITCNALQRPVQRRGRPHRRSYKWSLEAVFGGDKTLDDVWASMEVLVENAVSCNESRGGRGSPPAFSSPRNL